MSMDERDRLAPTTQPPLGSLAEFDEEKYLPFLEGLDLEDAQKREFLSIPWSIMRTWIVMDLPMDSYEQIIEALFDPSKIDSNDVD